MTCQVSVVLSEREEPQRDVLNRQTWGTPEILPLVSRQNDGVPASTPAFALSIGGIFSLYIQDSNFGYKTMPIVVATNKNIRGL
jgi:hypothetical protein